MIVWVCHFCLVLVTTLSSRNSHNTQVLEECQLVLRLPFQKSSQFLSPDLSISSHCISALVFSTGHSTNIVIGSPSDLDHFLSRYQRWSAWLSRQKRLVSSGNLRKLPKEVKSLIRKTKKQHSVAGTRTVFTWEMDSSIYKKYISVDATLFRGKKWS